MVVARVETNWPAETNGRAYGDQMPRETKSLKAKQSFIVILFTVNYIGPSVQEEMTDTIQRLR